MRIGWGAMAVLGFSWACARSSGPAPQPEDEPSVSPAPVASEQTTTASDEPAAAQSSGQETEECPSLENLEEACKKVKCRTPMTVRVRDKGGEVIESDLPAHPIVQCTFFTVYAGETVYVQADETPAGPVRLRAVDGPGAKTMAFSLSQDEDGNMMLVGSSPFSRPLKFQLRWMDMDGRVRKTSSCPIWPGTRSREFWPHPIFQIIVDELRFPKEGEKLVCN
jgi:hypothetical protein